MLIYSFTAASYNSMEKKVLLEKLTVPQLAKKIPHILWNLMVH